ncbi:MAG: DUF951 domain-containing protein [Firmicutes bacterium]|nr:DUF951 domain-containing protein [Bacillota bacterium]
MADKLFALGDHVTMKKPHPCGTNEWEIIRMGMDIRIKCIKCKRSVLLSRHDFERSLRKIVQSAQTDAEKGGGTLA